MNDLPPHRLVILDLDGTCRRCTVDGQPCPNDVGEQELIPEAVDQIAALLQAGYKIGFATNQAGPAYGFSTRHRVWGAIEEFKVMLALALRKRDIKWFEGVITVMVSWDKAGYMRKPQPGMLEVLMTQYGFEPEDALMIGDSLKADRGAAFNAGCDFLLAEDWHSGDYRMIQEPPELTR